MRIAVCAENGEVFQHFGHTPEFLACEVADGRIASPENTSPRADFKCNHRHEDGHSCGGHCHN